MWHQQSLRRRFYTKKTMLIQFRTFLKFPVTFTRIMFQRKMCTVPRTFKPPKLSKAKNIVNRNYISIVLDTANSCSVLKNLRKLDKNPLKCMVPVAPGSIWGRLRKKKNWKPLISCYFPFNSHCCKRNL